MDDFENTQKAAHLILKNEVKHLQLVPSVAIKLLRLTNDDNAKIRDLSRIIETEPTLAAKILRNVNSAAFSLPNKITSINRAVNILGFSAVRRIALAQLLYSRLIKHDSRQKFDQLFFWQHCLFVASLSRGIALTLKHPDPDMVYTAGLIHDIGKLVLETYGRSSYSDFLGARQMMTSTIDEERSFFGLTHAEIGHVFCQEWQIPASITAVVACHHRQPKPASPFAEYRQEIAIVALADHIAWLQGVGSTNETDCHASLQSEILEIIDVNKLNLDYLLQQVDQEMQNTREFYGIQFPSIFKLRAALVKSTIKLGQSKTGKSHNAAVKPERLYLASLTAPHQSLNPDDFLPRTLEAIQSDFSFDRVMMLTIDPKRRCLVATHCWPNYPLPAELQRFEIDIGMMSGLLLDCLRGKKAALINSRIESGNQILKQLKVSEFIMVPILHKQRLLGVIYADSSVSKTTLSDRLLSEISPIADQLGIALTHAKHYEMEKKQAQLDPLTQLYNKRMVNQFLTAVFQQHKAKLAKIAIGFIDIDHFKQVNDICGHQTGDDALKIVAEILSHLTRPGDFIGRYGGEEFIFLLRNTTEAGAFGYAERIRNEIEHRGLALRDKFHNLELTASIGVATYNKQFLSHYDMIEVADQAMYKAKHEGRNKVIMLTAPSSITLK